MARSRQSASIEELPERCTSAAAAGGNRRGAFRILHVDDEPDIREIVELSLGLDPAFTVCSCATAMEALQAAVEWRPDLILCDIMMPVLDGPATLARLLADPRTATIPVVFMTARAQTRELEHFKSLGAAGVISKPFDPLTLAAAMREQLRGAGLSRLRGGFVRRLRADAEALTQCRADLAGSDTRAAALEQAATYAHALAGAAGIFGFADISAAAAKLESATQSAAADPEIVRATQAMDALLLCIARTVDGADN
ncbi:MAG TPA: response regulator [Xanthobacteraceae bacterium]|nr:response regulator [Xanthobacteraceae bacterium]